LEQASEALRSEFSDWIPKTHAEIKSLLLDLAEKQVAIHSQTVIGWEQALKLATETNMGDLFKTVSKNAVQNLSPMKYASPIETERDFDDLSNTSDDFEVSKSMKSENEVGASRNSDEAIEDLKDELRSAIDGSDAVDLKSDAVDLKSDAVDLKSEVKSDEVSSDPLREFSEVDLSS
jgi:hypothetical protein